MGVQTRLQKNKKRVYYQDDGISDEETEKKQDPNYDCYNYDIFFYKKEKNLQSMNDILFLSYTVVITHYLHAHVVN